MASIKNTSQSNINVATSAGEFVFKAGEATELADNRVDLVSEKGAIYFTVGELVLENTKVPKKSTEASDSKASDAIKTVAKTGEEAKSNEVAKAAPAVKTTTKTATAAKK